MIAAATVTDKTAKSKERPRFGYRYKVRLKNLTEKKIKSIDWDYVFIEPNTQNEVARHEFTSDDGIEPGKERHLSHPFSAGQDDQAGPS